MNLKLKRFLGSLVVAVIIFIVTLLTKNDVDTFYVSLGDTFVMLGACFLPTGFAMLAAILGCGGAALLLGGWQAMVSIVLFRALAACWFMDDEKKILTARTAVGVGVSSFLFIVGSYMVEVLKLNDYAAPLPTLLGSALATLANVILFLLIAILFDKFKVKEKLNFSDKNENK